MAILGCDVQAGETVGLDDPGRRQGTYVVGVIGTGKSTLLLNIATSDIEAGECFCLLAPHGDLTGDLPSRIPPDPLAP